MTIHAYCSSGSLTECLSLHFMSSCQLQASLEVLCFGIRDEQIWIWWTKVKVTVISVSYNSRIDAVRINNIEQKFLIRLCFEVVTLNVHNVKGPFYFDMMILAKKKKTFPAIVRRLALGTEGDIVSIFLVRPDNWKLFFEICAAEFKMYESILA